MASILAVVGDGEVGDCKAIRLLFCQVLELEFTLGSHVVLSLVYFHHRTYGFCNLLG